MLTGAEVAKASPRTSSQSLSVQVWASMSRTTEAVCGACSLPNPTGSAFRGSCPFSPRMEYLYVSPAPRPGMNNSHTPVAPRERMGWAVWSQLLKLPTTETRLAFGAHTAK